MNQKMNLITSENDSGKRIDLFLAEKIQEHSRSYIQKLIKERHIEYNGSICTSPKTLISSASDIKIVFPELSVSPLPQPQDIDLDIIYEDDDILVINKKKNTVVHPADGTSEGTVVNALLWKFANFADNFEDKTRPGIVHRLDKDTTGCLLIAKKQSILEKIIKSFKIHEPEKTYLALVLGHFKNTRGMIKGSIARHPVNRKKMAVSEDNGKDAVSHFEVIQEGVIKGIDVSLLKVNIETGRTHQIRVHLSSIKKPVLGDRVYGGSRRLKTSRQMLHAWKLGIPHPASGEFTEFIAEIPEDMQQMIDLME